MAKKSKQVASGPSILDRLPKNRGEYLTTILRFTERAIRWEGDTMTVQAERIRKELEEWKKSNPA